MTPPSPSGREPLTRSAVVASAVAMADEEGVGALSMRKLAARLGFEVMSLYNHVANKAELLALMVDAVAAEIELPSDPDAPLGAIRSVAISTHDVLVRHPWAPALWQQHVPGPARTQRMEDLLRLLADSGLSPEIAHLGFHAVTNHVVGYTLQELDMTQATDDLDAEAREFVSGLDGDRFPHMVAHVHQHLDGETSSSFEVVLDIILDGLVRLDSGV